MYDLFYSDEQYREYCDDLAGDGYSNEYQRASAASRQEFPIRNETLQAHELTLAGKCVVIVSYPYYCRITSAVLGEELLIERVCDTLAAANTRLNELNEELGEDYETQYFIYRIPVPPAPRPPAVPEFDDECPF